MNKLVVKTINVLFFSHDALLYGATRSLVELAEHLSINYGINAHIVLPKKGPMEQFLLQKKLSYEILPLKWTVHNVGGTFRDQVKRLFQNLRVLNRCKKIVKARNTDIIYINTSVFCFPAILKVFFKVNLIIHIREFGYLDFKVKQDFGGLLWKMACSLSDTVISNSKAIQEHYKKKYAIKSEVIYNGINTQAGYDQKRQLKEKIRTEPAPGIFKMGIVGSIRPEKGQLLCLAAMNEVIKKDSKVHLTVIGGGKAKSLEVFIQEKKIEQWVTLVGNVDSVDSYYLDMDCILVCSKNEAFGRVCVEAMAYTIPVIGLNNAGTSEIIDHLKTGILFNGEYRDLADKILMLKNDTQLYRNLALKGWEHARKNFSVEKHTEAVYQQCILPLIKKS